MLPTIIVLNRNFAPASAAGPFKYGVVSYALNAADALKHEGLLAGFVLYRRDERLYMPQVQPTHLLGHPAIELGFHFRMSNDVVRTALEMAFTALGGELIYYQTNVLLPFHPQRQPFVVTHHAPFADHVVKATGVPLAQEAFGAGRDKLEHLRRSQRRGINYMAQHGGSALEISSIQANYLQQHGIKRTRISKIYPPLELNSSRTADSKTSARLRRFISEAGHQLILCTACARLDAFKNVELLVQTAMHLMESGLALRVLVIGGTPKDEQRRRLRVSVGARLADRFCFAPKIPRDELASLLDSLIGRGVFVCPSRYETCGLTPLEAAARGLCTLVTDATDRVEAARLVPPHHRFAPTVEALSAVVRRLEANPQSLVGEHVLDARARISSMTFSKQFITAWTRLTAPYSVTEPT